MKAYQTAHYITVNGIKKHKKTIRKYIENGRHFTDDQAKNAFNCSLDELKEMVYIYEKVPFNYY